MSDYQLPARATAEGAMARLFIAEASATHPSISDTVTAMGWMRRVLANRLVRPVPFGSRASEGMLGVIRAKRVGLQFAGFDDYPTMSAGVVQNIAEKLAYADNRKHPQQAHYLAFVRAAIAAAASAPPPDPSSTGLYFWRTAGKKGPGGKARLFQSLAGNSFYTLPADFFGS